MTKSKGKYLGDLRCELTHEESKNKIVTDAPKDNQGKGEAFSPTDLLANSLASCMLTIMAIRAKSKGIKFGKPTFNLEKEMQSNPRKVSEIKIQFHLNNEIKEEDREYLEKEAKNCPVALSLSSKVKQTISFIYD